MKDAKGSNNPKSYAGGMKKMELRKSRFEFFLILSILLSMHSVILVVMSCTISASRNIKIEMEVLFRSMQPSSFLAEMHSGPLQICYKM